MSLIARATAVLVVLAGIVACEDDPSPPSFTAPSFKRPDPGLAVPPNGGFLTSCPGYVPPIEGFECQPHPNTASCEYGHDTVGSCNEAYACENGRWRRQRAPSCGQRCPDRFDEIVPGDVCSTPNVGCSYLEGTCGCVADPLDGGVSLDAGPRRNRWRCAPPPGDGCPRQRPPLPSDCVRPMICDYGTCTIGLELTFSCSGRNWLQTDTVKCNP